MKSTRFANILVVGRAKKSQGWQQDFCPEHLERSLLAFIKKKETWGKDRFGGVGEQGWLSLVLETVEFEIFVGWLFIL